MSAAPGALTVALAGDTMLGRGVAERIAAGGKLFAPEVAEVAAACDLFVVNLECCVSGRGERWPAPGKPFFFRAPPRAVHVLGELGVDAVTLANNHALDYGVPALLDTLDHLDSAGIAHVGAGADDAAARATLVLEAGGARVALVAFCDHASDFAAGGGRPGIAYADLDRDPLPSWVADAVREARTRADLVIACPHWGPNMVPEPVVRVRRAARALRRAGAALVAGHSAHVPHGAADGVLYDLGDFVDDYAVDRRLRNDLGLLFRVRVDAGRAIAAEAFPLELEYCHTRLARGSDARWVLERFASACARLGAEAVVEDDRATVALGAPA